MESTRVPMAVVEAIQKKFFPDYLQIEKVLQELQYDSLNGCFYFHFTGMYHGVEPDGYIHT